MRPNGGPTTNATELAGRQVVLCGRLVALTHREAAAEIAAAGGACAPRASRQTSLAVVGSGGLPLSRDGRLSAPLARVRRLVEAGQPIEIVTEDVLLEWLGLEGKAAGVRSRFTAGQVADLLGVARQRLDGWIAAGLVQPQPSAAGVPLLDYRQAAAARTIADLVAGGVRLSRLRHSLKQLSRWLPEFESLGDLPLAQRGSRIVVRTPDGRTAELSGQLLLDFDEADRDSPPAAALRIEPCESPEAAVRRALALEEAGEYAEAAGVYRRLLVEHGPDCGALFNYGNVLYALGDLEAAADQFRRAALIDPQFAEAWNNLANVLAELDRPDDAVSAYRRALAIAPGFADAHFNLAETLMDLGRSDQAVIHWTAYLAFDPDSPWAGYARESREACQNAG